MCFPKEGAFAGVNCQVFVKGGPNGDLGAAFMNRVLDSKIQQGLAEATIAAPSVGGIEFKPDIAKMLPYPDKKMDELGLFSPDWAYVNKERPGWIEKMPSRSQIRAPLTSEIDDGSRPGSARRTSPAKPAV